jgi:hypothetical protein
MIIRRRDNAPCRVGRKLSQEGYPASVADYRTRDQQSPQLEPHSLPSRGTRRNMARLDNRVLRIRRLPCSTAVAS